MNIKVFESEEWERNSFSTLGNEHELEFVEEPLKAGNAERYCDAEILSVFIYSKLTGDVLEQFGNLRLITTRSTGYDHIDTAYCRENGIAVCNVPVYGENTVAEHVFALLLAISHNIVKAVNRTRNGNFSLRGLRGFDLYGKTLGVVGTGNIGKAVVRMARGFGMRVLASDLKPDEAFAARAGCCYVGLDELLANSDIVTLHVPASAKTRHLISKDAFARMKKGVILVNTSRGSVVDIEAMIDALAERRIAAAGLDVLPQEPVIREEAELLRSIHAERSQLQAVLADHILLNLQNVYITPHSAFFTREGVQRLLDTTIENIESFVAGRPRNVVVEPRLREPVGAGA